MALIVYATRYGATALTAQEIAKNLREEGFEVNVVDAKMEKFHDISEFELIIVGGGLKMGRWTGESDDFFKELPGRSGTKEGCHLRFFSHEIAFRAPRKN